jgi:ketosteroid isomerase-like protein
VAPPVVVAAANPASAPKPAVAAASGAPTVPVASGVPEGAGKDVEAVVLAWAKAWADKNMSAYLAAYDKEFATPNNQTREAWEEDRRLRITGKSKISVNLIGLNITVNGTRAIAKFQQDYKADALAVLSRKTLELAKSGDRWLIVKESTGN